MAGEFRKLPIKSFPKPLKRKDTFEQKYWKSFEFPTVVKEYTAINHVDFSQVAPYNCLVTCSGKIQIFAPYTKEVKRTYTRNKENVYGAKYRCDGKLLVAGGESGALQVLDVTSRSILRSLKGHTKPTHVCSFGKEFSKIYSGSDDKTIRCWDLATAKETLNIKAHKDYIRSGSINEINTSHFITGSYDHTIKVWDCRMNSVAMEMNHGAPVECIIMHDNGSVCLSAGSNYIKVWDMLGGGKLFNQFSNHQKTITTICFDDGCKRLFSGSLDRHVKVYDAQDYSVIANMDYPSPILAMDISKDSNHLTVGMSDGAISLRHRAKSNIDVEAPKKRRREGQPGTYLHRIRNQASEPEKDDLVVEYRKYLKQSKADKCLRKFKYHEALDAVIQDGFCYNTPYVCKLILELSRRDALEIAMSKRDAGSLAPIVKFLMRNLADPNYGKILIPVANLLIDMYAHLIGRDKDFDMLLKRLQSRIKRDISNQQEMIKLVGAIEQIFSMASVAPSVDEVISEGLLLNDKLSVSDGNEGNNKKDDKNRSSIEQSGNDKSYNDDKLTNNDEETTSCDTNENTFGKTNGHTSPNKKTIDAADDVDFVVSSEAE